MTNAFNLPRYIQQTPEGFWIGADHPNGPWRSIPAPQSGLPWPTDGPAVPEGREPASVATQPSNRELLELMPETMRDEFAYAAKICSEATGGQVKPRIFRVYLNTAALEYARAVLARWGRPTPAPAGEHQVAPVPVAVSERLPEPNIKVLAHYFNDLGKGRTICAIWVPAKTRSDSYGDDDFTEYDEESDTFYWPEGWYEAIENWDDLGWVKVDEGEVVYWQPLPKWPALPLPAAEATAEESSVPAPAVPALPPGYIAEHQGEDLELLQTFYAACRAEGGTADEIHLRGLRAVLAARPSTLPAELLQQRHPAPVPVAKRLPGPEDCDGEGRCWFLSFPFEYSRMIWSLEDRTYGCNAGFTHWLPATALPLPAGEMKP